MAAPIRVLLADDHALFREGLAGLIAAQSDFCVVGEASDGLEALVMAQELRPDLALLDVSMPGCDGIEAARRIREALPEVRIVMLTVHGDDERLFTAIKSGAEGYLLKTTASANLMPMLRGVMRGEAAISRTMAGRIIHEFSRLAARATDEDGSEERQSVTPREKEVLRLVAAGATDREIAEKLWITVSTVKTHIRSILAKLHAKSRYEAADYALNAGLIRRPPNGSGPGDA